MLKIGNNDFLFNVVADPLDVIIGEPPSKNNTRMLDLLMEVARKNIENSGG